MNVIYTEAAYEDYLEHSRTKGSKNGVWRYQHPDGTYTDLGKKRKILLWGHKKGTAQQGEHHSGTGASSVADNLNFKLGSKTAETTTSSTPKTKLSAEDYAKLKTSLAAANERIGQLKAEEAAKQSSKQQKPAAGRSESEEDYWQTKKRIESAEAEARAQDRADKAAEKAAKDAEKAAEKAEKAAEREEKIRQQQMQQIARLPGDIVSAVRPFALKKARAKDADLNEQRRAQAYAQAAQMSDDDLRKFLNRVNLEEQYVNKTAPVVRYGEAKTADTLETWSAIGGLAINALTIATLMKGLKGAS